MKSHKLPSNKLSPCHSIPYGQSIMSIHTLNEMDPSSLAKRRDSLIQIQ